MDKLVVLFLFLLSFVARSMAGGAASWSYNYSSPSGPDKWPALDARCNGTSQSPINIITNTVQYDSALGNLRFINYDNIPNNATVQVANNGHTFKVSLSDRRYFVSGGGLPGNFTTVQFHLHWGSQSHRGSEHLINGKAFAGAIHIVSYNTKYPNISVAVDQADGLAVLGVLLEVGGPNAGFDAYMNAVGNVINVSKHEDLAQPVKLADLLPSNRNFFRYSGSLTTPNCQESVTWTVFHNTLTVSEDEMVKLRRLREADGVAPLQNNYRHEMDLNGRVVKSNFDLNKPGATAEPATTRPGSHSTAIAGSILMTVVMATVMSALL